MKTREEAIKAVVEYWQNEPTTDGHPDENAIPIEMVDGEIGDGCLFWLDRKVETRNGHNAGYILHDGDYIFPGNTHVTRVVTED